MHVSSHESRHTFPPPLDLSCLEGPQGLLTKVGLREEQLGSRDEWGGIATSLAHLGAPRILSLVGKQG